MWLGWKGVKNGDRTPSAIARDLPAAGGMSDEDELAKIQRLDQLCQVVGPAVDVIPLPCLLRAAVAATVVSDDAVAVASEEEHLLLPPVGAQGPAVAEEDGGAAWGGGLWVPVLVVELGAIAEGGVGHLGEFSLVNCVSKCLDGSGDCAGNLCCAFSLCTRTGGRRRC